MEYGYHQSKIIPGLWTHEARRTTFTLVVDNFAIKIMSELNADHLIKALRKYYQITVDKEATKYIGLTIEWDYANGKVHTHMPGYLPKAMTRFKHETPNKIQNSPYQHTAIQYGAKTQFVADEEVSPPSTKKRQNIFKQWRAPSCTMQEQSTPLSSPHSAQLEPNRQHRCRQQWNR